MPPVAVVGRGNERRLQRPLPMSAPNANSDNADRAAKIIRDALGIEFDDVVNYCFRRTGRPTASGDGTPASSYAMTGRYWPAFYRQEVL
jgi:hypothetical protein